MALPTLPSLDPKNAADDDRPAIVIDTQVVMDWLVFHDARVQPLVSAVSERRLRWLVAPGMRDELRHVIGRGVAASYRPDLTFIEAQFDAFATAVADAPPQPLAGRMVCRDPDDQKFIDLAVAARARWLVSRDKALLALAKRARLRDLAIVTPERWSLG